MENEVTEKKPQEQTGAIKKKWQPMELRHLGRLSDLTQGGEGKLSAVVSGDPGEPTKKPMSAPG